MILLLLFFLTGVLSLKSNLFYGFTPKIADKSILLEGENQCKYSVIVFPGYGKDAKSYVNLCNKINEKMDQQMNFLILDYSVSIPFHPEEQADYIALKCIDYLKKNNLQCEKLYFMGHSAGAYFAREPAEKYSDGLIQLGCVLNSGGQLTWKSGSLRKYKKSVLTLLGQKDGYLNYLESIQEYQDILPEQSLYKPIIIEDNVNHLQMSDNIETGFARFLNKKDGYSTLSLEDAHDRLSDTISSFLKNTTLIQRKHNDGYEKISNYLSLYDSVQNIPEMCQYDILNLKLEPKVSIKTIFHNSKQGFVYAKPSIEEDGTLYVQSYLSRMNSNNLHSDCLWLKMKNQVSLIEHPKYQYLLFEEERTAKYINQKMFENYFNGSCPANVVFKDDLKYCDEIASSLKWIKDEIKIEYDSINNVLSIQSPTLYTNMKFIPRYAGMYYMKVLTPQLIEELINLYF